MKRVTLFLIVLVSVLLTDNVFADSAPCADTSTSASKSKAACAKVPAATVMVSIQGTVPQATMANAPVVDTEVPYKSVLLQNFYIRWMVYILGLLVPIGVGVMILLNLAEYRIKRRDKIEELEI